MTALQVCLKCGSIYKNKTLNRDKYLIEIEGTNTGIFVSVWKSVSDHDTQPLDNGLLIQPSLVTWSRTGFCQYELKFWKDLALKIYKCNECLMTLRLDTLSLKSSLFTGSTVFFVSVL